MGSDRRRSPAARWPRVSASSLARARSPALPAVLIALLACSGPATTRAKVQWTLHALVALGAGCIRRSRSRERVVRPLQTLANLLAALREGDFSIRARGARRERRARARAARGQRARRDAARRSGSARSRPRRCSRTVMEEIDVAVFAFDARAPAAAREPRRRAAARRSRPSACSAARRTQLGLASVSRRRDAAHARR